MPEFCKVIVTIRTMRQAIQFFWAGTETYLPLHENYNGGLCCRQGG